MAWVTGPWFLTIYMNMLPWESGEILYLSEQCESRKNFAMLEALYSSSGSRLCIYSIPTMINLINSICFQFLGSGM